MREQNPSEDEIKVVRDEGHNIDLELGNHSKVTESHVNEKQNHFEGVDDSDTDCENDSDTDCEMIVSTTWIVQVSMLIKTFLTTMVV